MTQIEFENLLQARASKLACEGVAALGPMYDLVASRLLRYCATLTRTREEAEDVLQASLLRLARHPQKLATAKRPWAYLLKLVRNEAYDLLYRKKPLKTLNTFSEMPDSCEIDCDYWERSESVNRAIRELPSVQAEVVTLKIWEGMRFREIAELTDQPLATITSRYRYAMEKLAELLKMYSEQSQNRTVSINRTSYTKTESEQE